MRLLLSDCALSTATSSSNDPFIRTDQLSLAKRIEAPAYSSKRMRSVRASARTCRSMPLAQHQTAQQRFPSEIRQTTKLHVQNIQTGQQRFSSQQKAAIPRNNIRRNSRADTLTGMATPPVHDLCIRNREALARPARPKLLSVQRCPASMFFGATVPVRETRFATLLYEIDHIRPSGTFAMRQLHVHGQAGSYRKVRESSVSPVEVRARWFTPLEIVLPLWACSRSTDREMDTCCRQDETTRQCLPYQSVR
jgi:hypothetical protein